jgi:ATP-binding cassette subfamily C protein CydD
MEGVVAADRIYGLLDAVPLVENVHRGAAPVGGPVEIRLEQLSYRYPGTDKPALAAVSTVIAPGRVTALAGPSGSGKSTLVNLLLGFLTYREGEVLVSGVPLRELDHRRHLARVAWVPQHPHLFNGTVFENLRLARPKATEAALNAALERAGADRFVRRLPQGGHTLLGNNGCRLSGGERQRLAVARAFLKDAPLLILDEPVAALDPESEAFLQQSLEQLAADRTVVVVAHRTATLRRADRVLLLDRGRLVAEGVHEDLRRDSALYAAMTVPSAEVLA